MRRGGGIVKELTGKDQERGLTNLGSGFFALITAIAPAHHKAARSFEGQVAFEPGMPRGFNVA